jgi:iron-sulfur cluster assembly protein
MTKKSDSITTVSFTQAAASHIIDLLSKRGHGAGLRVGVKKSGCSGYAYKLDFVDQPSPDDNKIEKFGASIYVSPEDLAVLSGLELDYHTDKMSSKFVFNNPNVTASCGCGESFAV